MKGRTFIALAVWLTGLTLTGACGRHALTGPPELRVGRDECAGCGMLISEDRCAGALVVERSGERTGLVFDDIGCMLGHEREHGPEFVLVDRFVRDYSARVWIGAGTAMFLRAPRDRLATPMGSGIVAFATLEAAEAERARVGGAIADYAALVRNRSAPVAGGSAPEPGGGNGPP